MKYVVALRLNPYVAALAILFLDLIVVGLKAFSQMKARSDPKAKVSEIDENDENIKSFKKYALILNALLIVSYLVGGHYGGSIILFVIGTSIYVYALAKEYKKIKA